MSVSYPSGVRVLVADPPWRFTDNLPGPKRGAAKHYETLHLDDIKSYPLPKFHRDGAWLFLWRVAAMQEEAFEVMRAWGFTQKAELVWLKTTKAGNLSFGMGHYVRGSHEVCLIGVRGSVRPRVRNIRSAFFAERGEHSVKPDEFYEIVRQLTHAPRVELFARSTHLGFYSFGKELK